MGYAPSATIAYGFAFDDKTPEEVKNHAVELVESSFPALMVEYHGDTRDDTGITLIVAKDSRQSSHGDEEPKMLHTFGLSVHSDWANEIVKFRNKLKLIKFSEKPDLDWTVGWFLIATYV